MDPNEQSINNDGDPNDLERIEFDYDEKDVLQSKGFPWQIADQRSPRWLSRTPLCIALVCHVLLIIILVSVLGVFACNWTRDHLSFGHHLLESPAKDAVKWEKVVLDNGLAIDNPFKGEPRPELDTSWESLIIYQNLAISKDKLDVPNSVQLSDGTNRVIFSLSVFHNLHCLNYIRKFIFRNGNYKDMFPESDLENQLNHVGHCVDMIRQSLICEGDIAISTYDWKMDHLLPWPNFRVAHECVDWDSIMAWAKEHAAPSLYGNILMHPKHGPSFPAMESHGGLASLR